ncbi:ABC transporter protein [Pleurostoma richardsiae]|uniref:ABC transporter protein n=1 Tax=Pleurostoma richardsiae TaxID=41990 RepID=A0AA38RTP4_9PEZI|nr:ABC transporter protein [Pleurostoma richardsiae]
MGSISKSVPGVAPTDDAVSLHSQPEHHYFFNDCPQLGDDDLPPLYDEHCESSGAPLLAPDSSAPGRSGIVSFLKDANTGAEYYLDRQLDTDPEFLEAHIRSWALTPPRPFVRVYGFHRQQVDNNGKKETKNVTDFDVKVELTPFLYRDATNRVSWRELRTVENSENTRRGTILKKRAPGSRQSIEVGADDKPTLGEWCHLYCASHAGLKTFALKRRIVGFDYQKVKEKLEALVRRTNYRGHLQVEFPVEDEDVVVYNDCRTNHWRLTWWMIWLCYLSLLFIFTWPYLWLRTSHFEVVRADWPFSRLRGDGSKEWASVSEDQWYNMWGRAIHKAVLQKRQATLDQQDLLAAESLEPSFDTGNSTVDGALGVLRAGLNAMNEVNRQFGWGADS